MVKYLLATEKEPIIQHRVFKPILCNTPIFNEIHTISLFNNKEANKLFCSFLNENKEVITRALKVRKINRKNIIHITYNNQIYALMK